MSHVIYTPIIDGAKSVFLYKTNILSKELVKEVRVFLDAQTYREGKCISGKVIPRLQLWFQREHQYFCDSWKTRYPRWESCSSYPAIFDKINAELRPQIEKLLMGHNIAYPNINSCLINKYRNGGDSIRAHRDTYLSFGHTPVILGVSFGDSRLLRVRRLDNPDVFKSLKVDKESNDNIEFVLEDNSLFIMAGYSQQYFSHEVPKMSEKQLRYSLTFREFINI